MKETSLMVTGARPRFAAARTLRFVRRARAARALTLLILMVGTAAPAHALDEAVTRPRPESGSPEPLRLDDLLVDARPQNPMLPVARACARAETIGRRRR